MSRMSVHEAKAHFSEVLKRVEAGETVTVTRHNVPVAEIKPIVDAKASIRLGAFEGEFKVPDEAFLPMTEDELRDWYGD